MCLAAAVLSFAPILLAADPPDSEIRLAMADETGGTEARSETDTDTATGVPIHSLYGDTKAPTAAMLADLDVLVYDLQDLGARYYTYASTMGLAMQAAAIWPNRGLPSRSARVCSHRARSV